MGDMGDFYRATKAARKADSDARKESNFYNGMAILDEKKISYVEHNGGSHVVITHNGKVVDYWPSTGKWHNRDGKPEFRYSRGISSLIHFLNQ